MANEKVFTLKIDGGSRAIKTVEDLKNSVKTLEENFEKAQFGTDEFKSLQVELGKAKARIRELDEATDGLTGQQKIEAFASIGEAITSAFAVGSVIESFIGKSEELAAVQEKVEKALLIVMAARAVAEGVKSAALLRNNALQAISTATTVAATTATGAATTATTLFGRAVQFALGPIGLIIAAAGALTAVYFSLADSAEEAANKQDKLNKELEDLNDNIQFQTLVALRDNSKIKDENARKTANLNSEERILNQFLTEAPALQEKYKKASEDVTLSQEERTKALQSANKLQDDVIKTETRLNEIGFERESNLKAQTEATKKLNAETQKLNDEALKKQLELFQKLADIEEQTRTETENARIQTLRDNNQIVAADRIELNQKLRKLDIEFNKQFLENLNNPEILAALQKQKETEAGIITRSYDKTLDRVNTTFDEITNNANKGITDFSNVIFGTIGAIVEHTADESKKSTQEILDELNAFSQKAGEVANLAIGLAQSIADLANQATQNQVDALDRQLENTQEKLDAINNNIEESGSKQQDLEAKLAEASIENRGAIIGAIEAEKKRRDELLKQQIKAAQEAKKIEQEKKELQIREFNRGKALSIASATVQGAQAFINALATTQPAALAPIVAALIGATVAAQIAVIAGQQPPAFKSGGFTSKGNADQPAGIVHAGEWVAPKWMVESPRYQPVIQNLESSRVNGYQSGGVVSADNSQALQVLSQAIDSIAAQANRPIVVNVQDIDSVQKNIRTVRARASL